MNELSLINKTKEILDNYGLASILYATAEFSPFSNQKKPDIQFNIMGDNKKVFFIEYKLNVKNIDSNFAQSIIEHYNFVSEDTPLKVFYAFATNTDINDEFLDFFSRNEITVFSHINTAEELSSAIVKWSESILE